MPRIPGVNHLDAARALERAGFRIVRQGKHIVDLPTGLARFRLPEAVAARLQGLLDRQDSGQPLTEQEGAEAEGLVDLAERALP